MSAGVALLRDAEARQVEVSLYPRGVSNAFGEVRATAARALRGSLQSLDFENGEGFVALQVAHESYFESAWLNIRMDTKLYSARVSAFPVSGTQIAFEWPVQFEVDDPDVDLREPFDDSVLMLSTDKSFAAYKLSDDTYRVRVENHELPFDFPVALASDPDVELQATVINHPCEGWLDVEIVSPAPRWSQPPPRASVRPSSSSGIHARATHPPLRYPNIGRTG